MTQSLVPESLAARAEPRKPFSFGFGVRFFIVLSAGLVWLIPGWWNRHFVAVMFVWDTVAFAAWLADFLRLPAPSQFIVSRVWSGPLTLAKSDSALLQIHNLSNVPVHAVLADGTPLALSEHPPVLSATLNAGEQTELHYWVIPRERGNIAIGKLYLRYCSALGFAERWAVVPLAQSLCVLPDVPQLKHPGLHLIRSRQIEMQKRRQRQRGMGREFESLREYREGDELRDICWSATARRHQLVTRTYTAERSQTVWIVVDAGRLLRAGVCEPGSLRLSKLDYSTAAALSVAQAALQHGDRAGLLAYGRSIQQMIAPARGSQQIRRLAEALAQVRSEAREADHSRAARTLLQKQSRRALIVWITDFAETPATPDVIEYAAQIARRHLVLFAAMGQPDLVSVAKSVPNSEVEMFRHAAALEIVDRRELLLRNLRQSGVLVIEAAPGRFTSTLLNEYLRVKERSLL